jgi:tRNA threonylcarbamoyladenosine biosynthesis protein TsaE
MDPVSTIFPSAEATQEFGASLAATCQAGEIYALHGDLGAGKTQIVKGFARGLGYLGDVTSPTFTLLHEYQGGRLPLFHLDLYRLTGIEEAQRSGLDEYLPSEGITVIEWPERIADSLPPGVRHYFIEVVSLTERLIHAHPPPSFLP